jgi:hypothetical protein
MEATELLQQLGLNKYEAEAYYTLLAEGPLTGYELGKRSQVPLSRSYEILERLSSRGLALLQPGDPPRYSAQDHGQFLAGLRERMTGTIDALTTLLNLAAAPRPAGAFWVVRGHANIQQQARNLIGAARAHLDCALPGDEARTLAVALSAAPPGQRIVLPADKEQLILLLADDQYTLAGTLVRAGSSEAALGDHPAILALLRAYFAVPASRQLQSTLSGEAPSATADWIEWETRKQRRLWQLSKIA